jgi:uncharacterized delta-60 repeat protein
VRTPELNAVRALVLQPDGMLVVGGAGAGHFMLARYDAAGVLDPTFGAGGVASTNFPDSGTSWLLLYAIVLQADGKIVAVGGGGSLIALARFAADGTLDATFGTGGRATTDVSFTNTNPGIRYPFSRAYRVSVLADGKARLRASAKRQSRAASTVYLSPWYGACAALQRRRNDRYEVQLHRHRRAEQSRPAARGRPRLIVEPDGGLVTIGWGISGSGSVATVRSIRRSPDDVPSGGAIDLVAQPDGRLVAAGYAVTGPDPTFEIVRFGGDCGNGVLTPARRCDDGNAVSGDGCDLNCTVTRCGNGIVTAGENCERVRALRVVRRRAPSRAPARRVIYEGCSAARPSAMPLAPALILRCPQPECVAPSARRIDAFAVEALRCGPARCLVDVEARTGGRGRFRESERDAVRPLYLRPFRRCRPARCARTDCQSEGLEVERGGISLPSADP